MKVVAEMLTEDTQCRIGFQPVSELNPEASLKYNNHPLLQSPTPTRFYLFARLPNEQLGEKHPPEIMKL
jgi:hypothetical protein